MDLDLNNKIISFVGSDEGKWNIISIKTICGDPLPVCKRVDIREGYDFPGGIKADWILKAFKSNLRYTTREEKTLLDKKSRALGQPEYDYAALIPIKKSDDWWLLTQDERREIFEEDSQHIKISSQYLTMISRQLHHSRDLGEAFDFITWFEFSSSHLSQFDELCNTLRKTKEWEYVIRETDIRVEKMQ